MGSCCVRLKRPTRISPWGKNRTMVLLFIGIDGAGKTTIVKALQGDDLGNVHQTVGFSHADIALKKHRITAYDLGGGERIREIWQTYYAEIHGVVYVVDSAAASRLTENKRVVESLIEVSELTGKPLLFLLNKKDLPGALDEIQFSDMLNLHQMAKKNKTDIRVECVCGVKGTGKDIDYLVVEGIEWLIEKILKNYDFIQSGVEDALRRLRERQIRERLERQHRMAAIKASGANTAGDEAQEAEAEVEERADAAPPAENKSEGEHINESFTRDVG